MRLYQINISKIFFPHQISDLNTLCKYSEWLSGSFHDSFITTALSIIWKLLLRRCLQMPSLKENLILSSSRRSRMNGNQVHQSSLSQVSPYFGVQSDSDQTKSNENDDSETEVWGVKTPKLKILGLLVAHSNSRTLVLQRSKFPSSFPALQYCQRAVTTHPSPFTLKFF